MFEAKDILWVRNVKANKGASWAYMDTKVNESFVLHWSKKYIDQKEALKPEIGDLILIFQKPNGFKEVQLTHLVTPTSNHCHNYHDSNPDFPWGREVIVIARAEQNSVGRKLNFKPVNQSHSYQIENLAKGISKLEVQQIIWNSFKGHFNSNNSKQFLDVYTGDEASDILEAYEGKEILTLKLHLIRERSSKLITEKKKKADTLRCQCCNFDFQSSFGIHGKGFIECHHKIPISQGERITNPDDLALVCSNCHRMLHRKLENGQYLTVDELQKIIDSQKKPK